MKILHCVESYYPALGGMQEVVKQLSERLVRLGHDVTVATRSHPERTTDVINGVKVRAFEVSGNLVNGIRGDKEGYENFLLTGDYEVVTFFAAQQWATDLALPLLPRIRGKKVSVPTGYSGLYWPDYQEYFNKMRSWIKDYDMNVYLSDDYRDIDFARKNGVRNMCIIANGAAEDEFLPASRIDVRAELGLPKEAFLILHVGSFTGWKGHHEAMEIFLRSRVGRGALLMIGNNYENFGISKRKQPVLYLLHLLNKITGRKKIVFSYFSREFTVAAYKQADIFLFPSNIECSPIVLFECAAAQLPFMATDVGNSAEIAGWTGGGMIMPTRKDQNGFSHARIGASVKMLNRLIGDQDLRKQLGSTAFSNWRKKYSWERITEQYESLYSELIKKP